MNFPETHVYDGELIVSVGNGGWNFTLLQVVI